MNILLAGEGGQGIQLIGQILAYAAQKQGKFATFIPNFGVEQRGGVSLAFIKISSSPIPYPKFRYADFLIVLSDRAVKRTQNYISHNTTYIYDDSLVHHSELQVIDTDHKKGPLRHSTRELIKNMINLPAYQLAQKDLDPKVFNFIILGALLAMIGNITKVNVLDAIDEQLGEKLKNQHELYELNLKALDMGMKIVKENPEGGKPTKAKDLKFERKFEGKTAKISHFPKVCKSCMLCAVKCPTHAISMTTKDLAAFGGPVPEWDMKKCIACETCEHICPDAAIKVEVKDKSS